MKKGVKTEGQLPLKTDLITRTGSVGNTIVVLADHREIKALVDSNAHGAEEVGAPHEGFLPGIGPTHVTSIVRLN